MRAPVLWLFVGALCWAGEPNQLTAEERAAGWQLLFDGTSSKGWLEVNGKPFPSLSWTIEDGCLKATPNPSGFQDLRSAGTFESFEFAFEWRILKGGNSGVKYLVQRVDQWDAKGGTGYHARARGFEYQLADDANEEAVRDPRRSCGSLYTLLAPVHKPPATPGVFHQSRLVVRKQHVEHWLDGVKIVEYELSDAPVQALLRQVAKGEPQLRPSPICLQNHASEAWFRNLKVRPLD